MQAWTVKGDYTLLKSVVVRSIDCCAFCRFWTSVRTVSRSRYHRWRGLVVGEFCHRLSTKDDRVPSGYSDRLDVIRLLKMVGCDSVVQNGWL